METNAILGSLRITWLTPFCGITCKSHLYCVKTSEISLLFCANLSWKCSWWAPGNFWRELCSNITEWFESLLSFKLYCSCGVRKRRHVFLSASSSTVGTRQRNEAAKLLVWCVSLLPCGGATKLLKKKKLKTNISLCATSTVSRHKNEMSFTKW